MPVYVSWGHLANAWAPLLGGELCCLSKEQIFRTINTTVGAVDVGTLEDSALAGAGVRHGIQTERTGAQLSCSLTKELQQSQERRGLVTSRPHTPSLSTVFPLPVPRVFPPPPGPPPSSLEQPGEPSYKV